MSRMSVVSTLFLSAAAAGAADVREHPGRRETGTPGLVLETGARTGACDELLFTRDGKYLLAAGDDKVVRTWAVGPDGALTPPAAGPAALRWPTFRENRGNIYALALSPDETRAAVAGDGQLGAFAAVVIDRATGEILHHLDNPTAQPEGVVWSVAYSADGKRVAVGSQSGGVWVWDPGAGKVVLAGRHPAGPDGKSPRVRLVAFDADGRVLSVAHDALLRWPADGGKAETVHTFSGPVSTHPALSADGKTVAAAVAATGADGYSVEVVPVGGGEAITLPFKNPEWVPHQLAFTPDGKTLAVGLRGVDQNPGTRFHRETGGRIQLFDLTRPGAAPADGPRQGLYAERLVFHPANPNWLAISDATNHDVLLWDLKAGKAVGRADQPGRTLWGVRFSADGKRVGFQNLRNPDATSPNARGAGDWRVFDFATRRLETDPEFKPAPQPPSAAGWEVLTTLPDQPRRADTWYVRKGPAGDPMPIPLDPREDEFPRCYAFVPAGAGRPERLVVGHYWGVSLFDLPADGPPKRIRVLRGHEGPVVALDVFAPADGPPRLVTASRDMTLAGWVLDDLPYHPQLGAEFFAREGKVVVGKVAAGGPAWEMGLVAGDQIVAVVAPDRAGIGAKPKVVYDTNACTAGVYVSRGEVGTAAEVVAYLRGPQPPSAALALVWRSGPDPAAPAWVGKTSVLDRPLWRFFPHGDRDWVLWRWRDFYYDCSTSGDFAIGWQKNGGAADRWRTPTFYRAEQFRRLNHRPDKVAAVLTAWGVSPDPAALIDPPKVELTAPVAAGVGYRVTVTATPQGRLEGHRPKEVRVWLNDYLLARRVVSDTDAASDQPFKITVDVPASRLRHGPNVILAQCDGRGGARGESTPRMIDRPGSPTGVTMYGLFVAVGDYRASKPRQVDLSAPEDATVLARAIVGQKGRGMIREANVARLFDRQVNRASVKAALEKVAATAGPDDVLVFHLGGHGTSPADLRSLKTPKTDKRAILDAALVGLGSFLFMCGDFNFDRLADTTIGYDELHDWLARVPCHKLVLLDACHSGEARSVGGDGDANPVRVLTAHGVGCVIMAACEADETALEDPAADVLGGTQGLFSIAIRRAFEEHDVFLTADKDRNKLLTAEELAEEVRRQVGLLVADINAGIKAKAVSRGAKPPPTEKQNPVIFLPEFERKVPVAAR